MFVNQLGGPQLFKTIQCFYNWSVKVFFPMFLRRLWSWKYNTSQATRFLIALAIAVASLTQVNAQPFQQEPLSGQLQISGSVTSGGILLPGVSITVSNIETGQTIISSTDAQGNYSVFVPSPGRYKVSGDMTAFSSATVEAVIDSSQTTARANMQMILQSRVPRPIRAPSVEGRQRPAQANARNRVGFQSLDVFQENATGSTPSAPESLADAGTEVPPEDVGTESVSISGAAPRMQELPDMQEMRDRMQEVGQLFGRPGGGGPGGGGPPGGFGGGPMIMMGGGPFGGRGGRRNANRPRGNVSYTLGDSVFDAKPYSLTGQSLVKPSYIQNRYSASIGGPIKISGLDSKNRSSFFFVSYDGNRSRNPYDAFSTVPTAAERIGDFSSAVIRNGQNAGTSVQIFDPQTHLPFTNNTIPTTRIDPVAKGLLSYIPLPNLPGSVQNFHLVDTSNNNRDNVNVRFNHAFGGGGGGGGPFGGMFGGGRGSRSGVNFNAGVHYQTSGNEITNPSPFVGGNTSNRSLDIPLGFVVTHGKVLNMFNADFNRSRTSTSNLYASNQNIEGALGIKGVSQNPFDWGLPGLSFTEFSGLRDVNPQLRRDQSFQIADFLGWSRGRHSLRWGGNFRRTQFNLQSGTNARGSFVFTGLNTAASSTGTPVPGTGYDFADFLLGLPQQTSVQFGNEAYYFRGNAFSLFAQDEFRVRSNLTLNLGIRYEYVSPLTEKYNRIVNLDVAPGFSSVVPVLPDATGAYGGQYSSSLLHPDRNNFAPRLGLAWKPLKNTVIRTGYGINYNTTAYGSIAQSLAFQPPFSTTQTNIQSVSQPLSLQNGFLLAPASVTNNFGVDPHFRLGYVQIWNADIQRQMPWGILMNLSYTGNKGTHLDMLRSPNRSLNGLLVSNVQPFLWQSAEGNSISHSLSVRVRRRFQNGFRAGGSYVYAKSIDNASSIGGGASVVAQNDRDLSAERGLSSFDQRHKFTADYSWELPFGEGGRWLKGDGLVAKVVQGWEVSGSITLASGTPFTAQVIGNFNEVSRGTNGSLRADATGIPVAIDNPSASLFFNTAAFTIPQPSQLGNAGRNTITGPRTFGMNMSLSKTVRLSESLRVELRAQATNLLNHVRFNSIDTTVNSPSFGRVLSAGQMRKVQFTLRVRF